MGHSTHDRSAAQVQAFAASLGFTPLVPRHPQQDALDKLGTALEYMLSTPEYADILKRRHSGELSYIQGMDESQKLFGDLHRAGRLPGYPMPPPDPAAPPTDPDHAT